MTYATLDDLTVQTIEHGRKTVEIPEELTILDTDGAEDGAAVGLINYPRFPESCEKIKEVALDLAKSLKTELKQRRLSVVFSDETIMLEEDE